MSATASATAAPAQPPEWFDAQYNNRARIPEHLQILQEWADRSAAARQALPATLDIAYGSDPAERLDLFPTAAPRAPVLVYIHGGYWRALDKRDASFVAPPFVAAGALVVVTNYALCPAASIEEIVRQQRAALAWTWRHAAEHGGDPARIVVAGHSAGGHLAAMMLATDWPAVAPDLPADLVQGALSLSGVFELEPLRHAPFLAPDLHLDAAAAARLSPVALPAPKRPLFALVGGDESEEFLRQNALIRAAWGAGAVPVCEAVPGRHHMSVLGELADSGSRTHRLALRPARPGRLKRPRPSAVRLARRQPGQQVAEGRIRPEPADPLRGAVEADEAALLPGLQALREIRIGRRLRHQHHQRGQRDQAEAGGDAPRHQAQQRRRRQADQHPLHRLRGGPGERMLRAEIQRGRRASSRSRRAAAAPITRALRRQPGTRDREGDQAGREQAERR